jgi:hypothetical protein
MFVSMAGRIEWDGGKSDMFMVAEVEAKDVRIMPRQKHRVVGITLSILYRFIQSPQKSVPR